MAACLVAGAGGERPAAAEGRAAPPAVAPAPALQDPPDPAEPPEPAPPGSEPLPEPTDPPAPVPWPAPGEPEPAPSPAPVEPDAAAPSPALPSNYRIGPSDVVRVTVWNQADLNGQFVIDADGTFAFPLIGRVRAGGLSLQELEGELRRQLADGYFRDPQVTVAVEQYQSQRLFIVGEVRNPGTYPLTGDMTLIEAIARAGSTLPAASHEALVVRGRNGRADGPTLPTEAASHADVVRVDLKGLQSGVLDQNVRLRDGDTIFVPRAETVYVFGQVRNPGSYPIAKDTTVLQALSLAGGVTDRGSTRRIRIRRIVDGEEQEINVQLDDVVQPGDTIVVRERFF